MEGALGAQGQVRFDFPLCGYKKKKGEGKAEEEEEEGSDVANLQSPGPLSLSLSDLFLSLPSGFLNFLQERDPVLQRALPEPRGERALFLRAMSLVSFLSERFLRDLNSLSLAPSRSLLLPLPPPSSSPRAYVNSQKLFHERKWRPSSTRPPSASPRSTTTGCIAGPAASTSAP